MMTSEIPERIAATDLQTLRQMAAMSREVLDENPNNESMRVHLGHVEAAIAAKSGRVVEQAPPADDADRRPRAGASASNQFGTFSVHAASERQVAFLQRLIDEKDPGSVKIPATLDGINKKAASALIDQLIDRPRKGSTGGAVATSTGGFRPASEKQVAFARSLAAERLSAVEAHAYAATVAKMSTADASKAIDHLKSLPRRERPAAAAAVEHAPGAYMVDGRVIRVYRGQQSGKMLAQELVDATAEAREDAWNYLGMASRFVPASARPMTVQECEAVAGASQADHSWCCVCGRRLDDPNSVSRSIGPICRAKQGAL